MVRYIFLSIFGLLLLTACGGSDLDKAGGEEPVADSSGARIDTDKESKADGKTRQKIEDVVKLDAGPIKNEACPIGSYVYMNEESPTTKEVGYAIKRLKARNKCVKCDFSGADLFYANLNNANLSGANLTRANLAAANLTGVNLTEATLFMTNLTRANLTGADLGGACLTEANLTEALLAPANLRKADLPYANLTGANLSRANVTLADLTGADLTGADLTGANLEGANLDGVIGADLTSARNVPAKYLKD